MARRQQTYREYKNNRRRRAAYRTRYNLEMGLIGMLIMWFISLFKGGGRNEN